MFMVKCYAKQQSKERGIGVFELGSRGDHHFVEDLGNWSF